MDTRWTALPLDSQREVQVILHPTASINEIRKGIATDGVDLTPFVGQGSHSAFDCNVTLNWNDELDGTGQPEPEQVLEIQLWQGGTWKPLWIGLISAVSSYTLSRGEKSMQLTANSRDSLDIFRTTKRVTDLYPQMTDLSFIAREVARQAGLEEDEIALPQSAFATSHSNTQLADMSAWEMLTNLCVPCGWIPFIDGQGRLRVALTDLQARFTDVLLEPEYVVRVNAQRQRPPVTRVRLKWLDPLLKKSIQQGRQLADVVMTTGWFLPYLRKTVYFSDDMTQRAESTFLKPNPSCNVWLNICQEKYEQLGENYGRIELINWGFSVTIVSLVTTWYFAHHVSDGVAGAVTVPQGRKLEAAAQFALLSMMILIGTGVYEIWGNPFDWVHARNTTDAFNADSKPWCDNPADIESDFILNEQHAQAVAVRELIYQVKSANKWSVTLVDDPRIEFGDVLEFPDGSRMYVENFTRRLARGDEAILEVSGFTIDGPVVLGTPTT